MLPGCAKEGASKRLSPKHRVKWKREASFLTETRILDKTTAEILIAEPSKNSSYGFSIKMEIGRSQPTFFFFFFFSLIPLGSFSMTLCFQTACNSPFCSKQIGSTRQGMKRWRAPCQRGPARLTSLTHHPAAPPSPLQPCVGSSKQFFPLLKTTGSFSQQNIKYKKNQLFTSFF